jgi:uncharacterized protein (TIGR03086 family)
MSQASRDYLHALWGFDAAVRRLDARDWRRATPCDRWDVGRLVHHNAMLCWATAEMVRGRPMAVPAGDAPDGVAVPKDGHVFRPTLFSSFDGAAFLADDPVAALGSWAERRDDTVAMLDEPGSLQLTTMSPWGHETVDAWLSFLFYDTTVHTWDLARSVQQPVVIDPALAARALDSLRSMGDHHDIRIPISLAPARTAGEDAPVVDRLIAYAGRDPEWRPADA